MSRSRIDLELSFRFRLGDRELDRLVAIPGMLAVFENVQACTSEWAVTDEFDGTQHHEGWWAPDLERLGATRLQALMRILWPDRFPAAVRHPKFEGAGNWTGDELESVGR